MDNGSAEERIGFLLAGAAIGAAVALLLAPQTGVKTRRRLLRQGEDAADYLIGAGKDLMERCEDLYKRSTELEGKAARELSKRYRELSERTKQLAEEAAAIISAAVES